jgi:TM2 domain-containing membrane protein YozV
MKNLTMKWIKKYCLTCIFLFAIFLTDGFPRERIFRISDSLYSAGQYRDARIELEKIFFFSDNPQVQTQALIRKAACFKAERNFQEASETLNRIFPAHQPDSLLLEIKYEKALAYYLNDQPGQATAELIALRNLPGNNEQTARMTFLAALSYAGLHNWKESKTAAFRFIALTVSEPHKQERIRSQIDSLFIPKNLPVIRSPQKAKNLSSFIPGGGQFYAGKIGEGLFSLGLHAALAWFGISQFLDQFYITGYTAGFGMLQRLYTGNLQRVQDLVIKENKKEDEQFLEAYIAVLTSTTEPL